MTKHAELRCEVCGTKNGDLRIAPIMRTSDPPVICRACMTAWYESGETTRDGILKAKRVMAASPWRPGHHV